LDQRPSPFVERLRHSREGGVVVDEHRQAEPILEHTSEVEVLHVQVHARADVAALEVDHGRHADAHGLRPRIARGFHRRHDLVDQPVGARRLRGLKGGAAERLVLERRDCHLRAADVNPDQMAIRARLGGGRGRRRGHAATITARLEGH